MPPYPAHRAFLLPFVLVALGCGGERKPGIVEPPDERPARVVASADSLAPAVYERVRVVVDVRTRGGQSLPGSAVRWRSTREDVARVEPDGTIEAIAVGEARIIAAAGEPGAEVADTVRVRVRPPVPATLEVSPPGLTLGLGATYPLAVTVRDVRGGVIPNAATITPASSVVTVDRADLRGTSAGTTSVTVRAGSLSETIPVRVVAGLPGSLDVFELSPDATVRLSGSGLAGGQVSLGGVELATTTLTDGSLSFTVPRAPFEPCRPPNGMLELAVQTPSGLARAAVGVAGAPVVLTLAPGQHAIERDALLAGCDVALSGAGDYLVMPFSWDRATSEYYSPGGTVPVRLSVHSAGAGPGTAVRVPWLSGPASTLRNSSRAAATTSSATSSDVLDLAAQGPSERAATVTATVEGPTAGESCPIPTTLGATIPLGTTRDSRGYVQLVLRGSPTEEWTLAALTPHLAVFYDSTLVRIAAADAAVAGRLARFVAGYDSTVIPLFGRYTDGVPDGDGNGRVVLLAPFGVDGFAYALPNGYGRPDCTFGAAGGEAILLRSNYMLTNPGLNLATALAFGAHETAHIVDHKRPIGDRQGSAWSGEGFAMQFNWLFAAGSAESPYTANRASAWTRVVDGTGTGYSCVDPQRASWAALPSLASGSGSYTNACAMVRAIVSRGVARGLSTREALMKFVALRRRFNFADAMNEYEGMQRAPEVIVGEWLMMWFADDFVDGTAPALQDPAMQWRSAWTLTPWALPEQTLQLGDAVDFSLGEPDVHHYVVTLPSLGRIGYRQVGGAPLPPHRAAIGFLRIR